MTNTTKKIRLKIQKIISGVLEVPLLEVTPEASLVTDLGADSLSLIELILTFEDSLDIFLSTEEEEEIMTVQINPFDIKNKFPTVNMVTDIVLPHC